MVVGPLRHSVNVIYGPALVDAYRIEQRVAPKSSRTSGETTMRGYSANYLEQAVKDGKQRFEAWAGVPPNS